MGKRSPRTCTSPPGGSVTTEVRGGVSTSKRYTANQLTEISRGGATGKYWYDDFGNVDCLTTDVGSQADCSPSDGVSGSADLVVDYGYDYLQRLVGVRQYTGGSRTARSCPSAGVNDDGRRFRTRRPSLYRKDYARAITSIAYRQDPQ